VAACWPPLSEVDTGNLVVVCLFSNGTLKRLFLFHQQARFIFMSKDGNLPFIKHCCLLADILILNIQ